MHAHLCLTLDYARALYMQTGAGEACVVRVTIAIGAVFGVHSIQAMMALLHRQRILLSAINI